MNTLKKKTWRWVLILVSGLAAVAASDAFDDPAPLAQNQAAMLNGYPAIPPAFNLNDIFKAPH